MSINRYWAGKRGYKGPKRGHFLLLHHHGPQVEWSNNVMKRVSYIKTGKPEHERAIRLAHIRYVPPRMLPKAVREAWATYDKAWAARNRAVDARDACGKARDAYYKAIRDHSAELDALIAKLIPDNRWNGKEIVFPKETR